MKPERVTLMLVCTILLGLLLIQPTMAQTTQTGRPFPLASPFTIMSPINTTYTSSPSTITASFKMLGNPSYTNITYKINGQSTYTIPTEAIRQPIESTITHPDGTQEKGISIFSPLLITGKAALPELAEGQYKIVVYSEFKLSNYVVYDEQEVYFTVDDGTAPAFSDLSVDNKTYSQNSFSLYFELDQPVQWMGYSLDGQENLTIDRNTTLSLETGSHNLQLYATDNAGNMGATGTIYFTIAEPITTHATLTLVIAVAVLGIIVYFKKHKSKTKISLP